MLSIVQMASAEAFINLKIIQAGAPTLAAKNDAIDVFYPSKGNY